MSQVTAMSDAARPGLVIPERLSVVRDQRPDQTAVEFDGRALTYAQLWERAARVAGALRAHGVGADDRVGVCAERGLDLLPSLVGILMSGAGYVPIDLSYPAARQSLLARQAGLSCVLVPSDSRARLQAAGSPVITVDEALTHPPEAPVAVSPNHTAYVMFTSGSSGRPKGVVASHGNVVGLADAMRGRIGPGDRVLGFAPLAFDASTFELWACLLAGGTVVLAPTEACTPRELIRFVERNRVSALWLTAALFQQAVDEACDLLAAVRLVLTGGDVVPVPQVKALLAAGSGCIVVNGYGPTETTTFATNYVVRSLDELGPGPLPIGLPVPGARLSVRNERLRPVPDGAEGELFVSGSGVARGYLGLPGATAQRFLPDPDGPPGSRMYRTGDLVVRDASGVLHFRGRLDQQVKIRGYRVETGEVEATIAEHPRVRAVAVVARVFRAGDRRLVAHVVGEPDVAKELRAFLSERLPEYMVPARFEQIEVLPVTENGKVDRQALEKPTPDAPKPTSSKPTEAELRGLWAELLEVPAESITDDSDFFHLGGHSLLVIQVVWRLEEHYGVELPVRSLYDSPTFGGHCSAVAELASAGAGGGEW